MEKETKVTEPVEQTKTEENKFTQEDVSKLVAKESKKAVERLLKDLGVEDVKNVKEGINQIKKDKQEKMTDYEKAQDKINQLESKVSMFESQQKEIIEVSKIRNILKEENIDPSYANVVKKMMTGDVDRENVLDTVENELPILLENKKQKIGLDKKEFKTTSSIKSYLDDKYKDNPFYKK